MEMKTCVRKIKTPSAHSYGLQYCTMWKWRTPEFCKKGKRVWLTNKIRKLTLLLPLNPKRHVLFHDDSLFHCLPLECKSLLLHLWLAPKTRNPKLDSIDKLTLFTLYPHNSYKMKFIQDRNNSYTFFSS